MPVAMGDQRIFRDEENPDLTLHVRALEWKVKDLARQNHELRARLYEAEEALHLVHGSRGWRLLEALRRRVRGNG